MATCTMYGSGNHAALSANPCVAAAKAAPIARWRELAAADLRRAANAFGESALPSTTSVLIHARGGRTG